MFIILGTLMACGDGISQTFIEKRLQSNTYEPKRTLRFLGFGFCFAVSSSISYSNGTFPTGSHTCTKTSLYLYLCLV